MKIYEEHPAKGCYHYYDDYMKIGYTCWGYDRRTARRKLRERYPHLDQFRIRFIQK